MEKDWPKRPSDHQLQEAQKKDSDRAITPVAQAVHVPAHLAPPESPLPKQVLHLHAQHLLGQSCHRQKVLHLCVQGCFGRVRLCDPIDCGLPGFSVREGVSPSKNIGVYWPILVAIPF